MTGVTFRRSHWESPTKPWKPRLYLRNDEDCAWQVEGSLPRCCWDRVMSCNAKIKYQTKVGRWHLETIGLVIIYHDCFPVSTWIYLCKRRKWSHLFHEFGFRTAFWAMLVIKPVAVGVLLSLEWTAPGIFDLRCSKLQTPELLSAPRTGVEQISSTLSIGKRGWARVHAEEMVWSCSIGYHNLSTRKGEPEHDLVNGSIGF